MSAVVSAVGIPRPNHPNSRLLLLSSNAFFREEEQQLQPQQSDHRLATSPASSSSVSPPTLLNTSSQFQIHEEKEVEKDDSTRNSSSGGAQVVVVFPSSSSSFRQSSPRRSDRGSDRGKPIDQLKSIGETEDTRRIKTTTSLIHKEEVFTKKGGNEEGVNPSTWGSAAEEEGKTASGRCCVEAGGGGDSDCSTRSCRSLELSPGVKERGEEEGRRAPFLVRGQELRQVGGAIEKEVKASRCVREDDEKKKCLLLGKSSLRGKSSSDKEDDEEDRKVDSSPKSVEPRTTVGREKKEEGLKKKKKQEKFSGDREEISPFSRKLSAEKQKTSSGVIYGNQPTSQKSKNCSFESDLPLRHSSLSGGKIEKSSTRLSVSTGGVGVESHRPCQPKKNSSKGEASATTTEALKSTGSLVDLHSTSSPPGGGIANHLRTGKKDLNSSSDPQSLFKSRPYLSSSSSASSAGGEIGRNSPSGKKNPRVSSSCVEAKSPHSLKYQSKQASYSSSSQYSSHTPANLPQQGSSSASHHNRSSLQQRKKSSSHLSAKGGRVSSPSVANPHSPYTGGLGGVVVASQLSSSTLASSSGAIGGGRTTSRGTGKGFPSSTAGGAGAAVMAPTVMNTPTRIESGRQRFLILDAPSHENLAAYIAEMKAFEVTDLVRTCEPTYDEAIVHAAGIQTHELIFPDGEAPPDEVIDEWLDLCDAVGQQRRGAIAVHCVAGLGRAPVLVAVALIEKGMDPMDAIMFIRERRKGMTLKEGERY